MTQCLLSELADFYPAVSLANADLPPRSVLYALPPVGIGTELVESLTGYLARLAASHLVRPTWLLKSCSIVVPSKGASGLNGACPTSSVVARLLEDLTGVGNLERLTLLPWQSVLSSVNSLARTQHWCTYCLREWQVKSLPTYYPLQWCLTSVRCCHVHGCGLTNSCPNPRCRSPVSLFAVPGFCGECWTWLGQAGVPSGEPPADDTDVWFARATAGLIWRGQLPGAVPTAEDLRSAFTWLFEIVGAGHWDRLRRRLKLSPSILYCWRSGRCLPSLDMLLTLCYYYSVT